MVGGILALERRLSCLDPMGKRIRTGRVTEDETTAGSLRTKVVVQPLTLVGGNGGCRIK